MIDDAIKERAKVARKWGQCDHEKPVNCYSFNPVRKKMLACLSGKEPQEITGDWIQKWAIATYLKDKLPVDKCLSICCGPGGKERNLSALNVFLHCTAIDLSEKAIEEAQKRSKEEGIDNIDYMVGDINEISLPPDTYDLVYASGALHHLSNLDHVVSEVYKTLKPGGILLSDEYVGPPYNDLTYRHREIINSVIHLIPPSRRYAAEHLFVPGFFRTPRWNRVLYEICRIITFRPLSLTIEKIQVQKHDPFYRKWMIAVLRMMRQTLWGPRRSKFVYGKLWDVYPRQIKAQDPSEGVRADQIIPTIKRVFGEDIDIRYFNGSVFQYVLDEKFISTFDHHSPKDKALFDMIATIEKTMIDIGEIPSILAHVYGKKEAGPA